MRQHFILLLVLILLSVVVRAQMELESYSLDKLIEELSENSEEATGIEEWIEELHQLHENPIDLNKSTIEQLGSIPFLDPVIAGNIIRHRTEVGEFFTLSELSSVEGVSPNLAMKLALFLIVTEEIHQPIQKSGHWINQQLLIKGWQTLPLAEGYLPKGDKPPAYLGDPRKYYTRYSISRNNSFEAGITADKDPGEPFFSGANRSGFDFYSAHLTLHLIPEIPQLIIGDYSLRTGQGLILQPGFSLGKTANPLHAGNPGLRLRPYTSTDENFFFRGLATQFRHRGVDGVLFLSHKKSDGNRDLHKDGSTTISSLQTSGYHRTISEMEDKNQVGHSVAGAIFSLLFGRTRWSTTLMYERLQYPIVNGSQLYQKYHLQGKENINFGIDYRYVQGKYQLFGEGAICKSGGLSFVQGLQMNLHDQLSMSMLYRNYGYRYHATWGNGFGEAGQVNNESGFYTGLRLLPMSGLSLSAYADWFSSTWMNYSTAGPSKGTDLMVQGEIRLSRKMDGYIRYKNKVKSQKESNGIVYEDNGKVRSSLRIHLNYLPNENWIFRTRTEQSFVQMGEREKGFMILQDVGWTPKQPDLSLFVRFAFFKTGSFESRVYAYENDMLYNFSTLSFFGKGFRTYLNLRFRFSDHLDAWIKLANTTYNEQDNISSGYNKIEGNSKTEMKMQLRYRL